MTFYDEQIKHVSEVKDKQVEVDIQWVDEEVLGMKCPNCGEDISISIYREDAEPCTCGKRYYFHQICPVFEIIDGQETHGCSRC